MQIQAVKHILWAQDMDRAVAFYRDAIGLTVRDRTGTWSELSFGDAVVALHGGGDGELNQTGLCFQVDDLEGACRDVEAGGGKLVGGPWQRPDQPVRVASVIDTEGNSFSLTEQTG